MQKSLTVALAAAGLLAASQVSFANALAPSSGTNLAAQESSQIVPVRMGGGGGGGFGHGGGGVGPAAEWAMASAWVTGSPEDTGQ